MSTTTLEFKFALGGVATDPDGNSVLLSDPTGSYGVRREDTLAGVVDDATPMERISVGLYRHTFTDPAAGLLYRWWAECTVGGAPQRFPFTAEGGIGAASDGIYYSYGGIKSALGKYNLQVASELDGGTGPNYDRIKADGETADAYTNRRARLAGYETPVPSTSGDIHLVRYATDLYAAFLLQSHRGWEERGDEFGGKVRALRNEAMALYDTLFGPDPGGLDAEKTGTDVAGVGEFTSVRLVWTATSMTDEFGG